MPLLPRTTTWEHTRVKHLQKDFSEIELDSPDTKKGDLSVDTQVDSVTVLGFDLTHYSTSAQFFICALGVFVCYMTYASIQEYIFRIPGYSYGWYMTFVQFIFYTCFASVALWLHPTAPMPDHLKVPLKLHVVISFFIVMTMGTSNAACQFLNYPTQVMFKSCKPIPVMAGSIILLGKRYTSLQFLSVFLLCCGAVCFSLADMATQPNFNPTGIVLACASLVGDLFSSNIQERTLGKYKISSTELIFYQHSIGAVYLLCILLVRGDLVPAFVFCLENQKVYFLIFLFAVTGYCGVSFLLALLKSCGALTVSVVTTSRKTATIILSFLLFPKPFSVNYIYGALALLLGLASNIYSSQQAKKEVKLTLPITAPLDSPKEK